MITKVYGTEITFFNVHSNILHKGFMVELPSIQRDFDGFFLDFGTPVDYGKGNDILRPEHQHLQINYLSGMKYSAYLTS